MSLALIDKYLIDLFREYYLGLFGLLVKNGVVQEFAFIEDGDVVVCIQADRDSRFAHGIGGALSLDLVDDLFELQGQVFGEHTGLLPLEKADEIVLSCERTMSVMSAFGLDSKAAIEVIHVFWQEGIACFPTGDTPQA